MGRHQESFDKIKDCLSRKILVAYPKYGEVFDIYIDASTRQLGAVITQNGKPLAFFSRKLSKAQRKYSITELELLSIVECLKEFKGMLLGQRLKVFTDHTNLVRDALGMTCNLVYCWRLLFEEYGHKIVYIKGVDNIVADAISCLEYDPEINVKTVDSHRLCCTLVKLLSHYSNNTDRDNPSDNPGGAADSVKRTNNLLLSNLNSKGSKQSNTPNEMYNGVCNTVFATISEDEDNIYPPQLPKLRLNNAQITRTKSTLGIKPLKEGIKIIVKDN